MPTDGLYEYVAGGVTGTPPIALDLNDNGLEFVAQSETGAKFDLNGTGPQPTAWLAPNDGWLFIDLNGDNLASDRDELIFVTQVPAATSDLDALRIAYDSNANDLLDAPDTEWSKSRIWQDLNQDGISTADEVMSLAEAEIVSIGLVSDGQSYTGASGAVTVLGRSSFLRSDGSEGTVGDVVLNTQAPISGSFVFSGGADSTYVADADTDWTLSDGVLTGSDGKSVALTGFTNVELRGGDGNNQIEVVSWNGNVTINGGNGADTIILHAGSGANVKVLDTGAGDELDILGTDLDDQILVTANSVNVLPAGSSLPSLHVTYNVGLTTPTGLLRISGGQGADVITVNDTSCRTLELDGSHDGDTYRLVDRDDSTITQISETGTDDAIDTLTVFSRFMPAGDDVRRNEPSSSLQFGNSIEVVETKSVDPILNITGSGTFWVYADAVLLDGVTRWLEGVTDLTITTINNDNTIRVEQIPSTLTTFTINAMAGGDDTLIGLNQTNDWQITGPNSGHLEGTLDVNFSGIENLTGRTGTDTFTFSDGGSISGVVDGGSGADVVDYSASTAGVTVDLGTGRYSNIETLIGSTGDDTLVGPNTATTWNVTGSDSGNVGGLAFSGIENLTGGSAADDFLLSTASVVSGGIDGGAGDNRIEFTGTGVRDVVVVAAEVVTIDSDALNGIVALKYDNIGIIDLNTLGRRSVGQRQRDHHGYFQCRCYCCGRTSCNIG